LLTRAAQLLNYGSNSLAARHADQIRRNDGDEPPSLGVASGHFASPVFAAIGFAMGFLV